MEEVICFHHLIGFIEQGTAVILASSLRRVVRCPLSEGVFGLLSFLLTGNSPVILRSQICCVVFSAYWETSNPLFAIQYFIDLCSHLPRNCYECHRGGLDLELLTFLRERRLTEEEDLIKRDRKSVV
jgi:hypothetical protein